MALGRVNRNEKWRLNDIVFVKECSQCGVTVEWQAADPNQNNANNFHTHLFTIGWKKQGGFLRREAWVCNNH